MSLRRASVSRFAFVGPTAFHLISFVAAAEAFERAERLILSLQKEHPAMRASRGSQQMKFGAYSRAAYGIIATHSPCMRRWKGLAPPAAAWRGWAGVRMRADEKFRLDDYFQRIAFLVDFDCEFAAA